MPIVLYHCPRSRSSNAIFLLEELGEPYEIQITDVRAGAGQTREFLAINPMGKVPTIRDGDDVVSESGAICLYLADRYPQSALAPPIGNPERAGFLRWLFFNASLDAVLVERMVGREPMPAATAGHGDYERVTHTLKTGLAKGPWLLGDRFSAADILIGGGIPWALANGTLPRESPYTEYASRIAARPAYARAQARDNG